ncbi:MAG: tRNA (guanosine(46)-N7)-methyltransferase TrmB [Ilumatobacteraceae bacterium]
MPDPARSVTRPASTFKRRRRKLSPKRQAELEEWIGRWGLDPVGPPVDLDALFGRAAPVYLDVGFGHGESTIELARVRPDVDVIGVEVHDPGVVTVLDAVENVPLPNVRVVHGDVLSFLDRVPAGALAGVCVFFPDPWPKPRQRHRRLIRADVVAAFAERLRPGGELLLATDIVDYAEQMIEACDGDGRLTGGVADPPSWRPSTRFERRGRDEGRPATDLCYRRL